MRHRTARHHTPPTPSGTSTPFSVGEPSAIHEQPSHIHRPAPLHPSAVGPLPAFDTFTRPTYTSPAPGYSFVAAQGSSGQHLYASHQQPSTHQPQYEIFTTDQPFGMCTVFALGEPQHKPRPRDHQTQTPAHRSPTHTPTCRSPRLGDHPPECLHYRSPTIYRACSDFTGTSASSSVGFSAGGGGDPTSILAEMARKHQELERQSAEMKQQFIQMQQFLLAQAQSQHQQQAAVPEQAMMDSSVGCLY